ncbi:MAG: hypothetical protein JWR56_50 [Massilia sp.]|nr:hypothetical protein [Massilia sp.]
MTPELTLLGWTLVLALFQVLLASGLRAIAKRRRAR